jgi:hypothetical protein
MVNTLNIFTQYLYSNLIINGMEINNNFASQRLHIIKYIKF